MRYNVAMQPAPPASARPARRAGPPNAPGFALRPAVARALGVTDTARTDVLREMLDKPSDERAVYWLQLFLSMGIATFGLVLDSTGVVIGAMLIAPLMTPIVELSMSLVVMSAYLLVKALARVVVSVLAVSLGAALITLVLPFRVATPEILARTSPTLLDLFVAICCALAAAVITARPHGGATSTAAGTAIGISLVPPLCAAGFGIGSGDQRIAEGAFMLFTANFCAILAFAAAMFWLMDFQPAAESTATNRRPSGDIDARHLALARLIESRVGPRSRMTMRVLVPALLLAVIIQPLSRALREVSEDVRARNALNRIVAREPLMADAIRVDPIVSRGSVDLRAVVVGSDRDAADLQRRLATALVAATGADAHVQVRAVQQATLAERARETSGRVDLPVERVTTAASVRAIDQAIEAALRTHLPPTEHLLDARAEILRGAQLRLTLAVEGTALDERATAILGRGLSLALEMPVDVATVALPADPRTAPVGRGAAWLADVEALVHTAAGMPNVAICLTLPDGERLRGHARDAQVRERLLATWPGQVGSRVSVEAGSAWSVRFARGACTTPPATATPGTVVAR